MIEAKLKSSLGVEGISSLESEITTAMDTAEGRNLASRIASYYVIPFIDVGVRLVADGRGSVESIAGAVNYYKPGGSTLLERGAISSEQIRAEETQRTNPELY
jgi:hypothetical protein